MKKIFQKPLFKNIVSPLLRGGLKLIPIIGTPLAEIATNVTQIASAPTDPLAPKIELKHKWVSIAVQVGGAALILYGLYTKQITLEQLFGWLGLADGGNASPIVTP